MGTGLSRAKEGDTRPKVPRPKRCLVLPAATSGGRNETAWDDTGHATSARTGTSTENPRQF